MIKLIFGQNKRYKGVIYSDRVKEENKNTREISESELNELIPDSFEETDWKEVRRHYKLDEDGEVVFDEDYEPDEEE